MNYNKFKWNLKKVNTSELKNIKSNEMMHWKYFQITQDKIVFLFSSGYKANCMYICKLCIDEKNELYFYKPKKINYTHKLFILNNCLQVKNNVIVCNDKAIFFDEINNTLQEIELMDFY